MYEKQNWKTGDVITQEKLNHMEDGIASSGGMFVVNMNGDNGTLDKTWQEIYDAIKQKTQVIIELSDTESVVEIVSLLYVTGVERNDSGCKVYALYYNLRESAFNQYTFSSATSDGYPQIN